MGAFVGAVSGYSARYYAAQAGAAPDREAAGSYYVKEAPGRWFGRGLDALGLHEGQAVDIELDADGKLTETGAFFDLYEYQRHPVTGEILGRRPNRRDADGNRVSSRDEQLAQLLEAEPWADAKRLRQLAAHASRQARPSPRYTDVTTAFSKSISVFHASLRANIRAAELAGDGTAVAYWTGQEAVFSEVLQAANLAALRHAERWAMTRTGYHGAKVGDRETGKWAEALPVISSWQQGTSREGDPHDHVHNLWARVARTADDGKWRALDTMALRHQLPAMAAIASAHVEAALAREFGVSWVARADGAGNEIRGITQAQMDAFSSRRQAIDAELADKVDEFTGAYGRSPSRAELMHLRDTIKVDTRSGKDDGAIDWNEQARIWEDKLKGELAPIAETVSALRAPGTWRERAPERAAQWQPSREALAESVSIALATVQAQRSTWGRADLMREVSKALPAESRAMDPADLVRLVHGVTDEALRGAYEQVVPLDAPEWPPLPDYLRRGLDGRSVYTRPGTEKYATQVQLSMEERLLAAARRNGAPCLRADEAARALGADAQALDAALRQGAQDAREGERTATGLRLDQGAAAYHLLTSPRTVEVLVGPAGSGKTFTVAAVARAWAASGRHVIGLATSQQGANALREAGIEDCENLSMFLGHMPRERGKRGVRDLPPETLVVCDEATMTSMADLADLAELGVRGRHKVAVCGDHAQIGAVEAGGGMNLTAGRLGYVQLAEAERFMEPWEAAATLRLREHDVTVLDEYTDHGRLRGGSPEQVKDEARRLFVSHHVQGTDVALITMQRERAQELAAAVQDDLRHLGFVDAAGPSVPIGNGAQASAGDMIRATANDHRAGVANKELFLVEAVNADGSVSVRRDEGRDSATGCRIWSQSTMSWRGYATAELGYATTEHSKQGSTVTVGITVVNGSETAEWVYSAATRGARQNLILAETLARAADPAPASRAAPEIAERDRVGRERAGQPVTWPEPDPELDCGSPQGVVAQTLGRSGVELAALDVQAASLANADHLAALGAMWEGETAGLIRDRYRGLVAGYLPEGTGPERLESAQSTWLWRTLDQADAAGLDVRAVVERAVAGRSLEGVRDVPSVIDARIRREAGPMLPARQRRFAEQVPEAGDPEKQSFLEALAGAMDDRVDRLGEDAAEHEPGWAVNALGPVPEDPLERLEWTERAKAIGHYREQFDWHHPAEPCGPEPSSASPKARAVWHAAYGAMNRTGADDMSRHQDGSLLRMRQQYEREYSWAPDYPAAELEAVRAGVIDQDALAARSDAEAAAARQRGEEQLATRHAQIAASARAAAAFYRQRAAEDEAVMADRQEWERVTEGTRNLALRADSEYRRRHPDVQLGPLTSGEAVTEPASGMPQLPAEAEAADRAARMAEQAARFREQLEERQNVMVPSEDPDYEPIGEAWPTRQVFARDAVLQPPKPEIRPAEGVLQAARDREAAYEPEMEAGA